MVVTRNAGRLCAAPQEPGQRNPSRATRASRSSKRPCYAEPSDLDESSDSPPTPASPASEASAALESNPADPGADRLRLRRSCRAGTSWHGAAAEGSRSQRSPKPHAKSSPHRRRRQKAASGKRQATSSTPVRKRKLSMHVDDEPVGFIPDWQDSRVPFQCWVDIFHFAARVGAADTLSPRWLAQAATTCKTFAEPALTALYRCPIIRHSLTAKHLASLLGLPASETRFNYRAKIEAMLIDIHTVPLNAFWLLIHPLPRLKELIIYTPLDQPPYRELDKNIRWHYPPDIFLAFDSSTPLPDGTNNKPFPTRLQSWEWSGRLIGGHGHGHVPNLKSMASIHQTAPFRQLTRLALTNFQVPSLSNLHHVPDSEEELETFRADGVVIEDLAEAISQLANLNHLVFESSTVMNDRLLPLLPANLSHLELINCWEVKSEDLARFLRTHGRSLRTLSLLHNQSLDLGFLTDLSDTCPGLRELHMNLSYYRHHDSVNDADPMYEQALLPGQVPTWPSTLRVINIDHIRDWSVEAAETFFQSLIDSAGSLPDLRHIGIKTMLNIPWQARATMRQEWRDKMEKTFLRPLRAPADCSTLRPPAGLEQRSSATGRKRPKKAHEPHSPPVRRRMARLAARGHTLASGANDKHSRALRRRESRPVYVDRDTDEDETGTSESGEEGVPPAAGLDESQSPVQGLCNTVNILVDNQKVGEQQYGMEDFLDGDEEESEEEWVGDYDDDDDDVVVF